jgi:hypothetical protein
MIGGNGDAHGGRRMLRFCHEELLMKTPATCSAFAFLIATLGAAPALASATALPQNAGYGAGGQVQGGQAQGSGYGYGQSSQGAGYGNAPVGGPQGNGSQDDGSVNGVPRGVGYNQQGGEMSRTAAEDAALAPEFHMHMVGPSAANAVGSGGGPVIPQGEENPGYVQAKFVTPYGNATVMHHYGPGYPPPMGSFGGSSGGNAGGGGGAPNGTVAGNPGLVNWGLTPAWDAEEMGNGAWFGTPSGNSPMPYIGGFND